MSAAPSAASGRAPAATPAGGAAAAGRRPDPRVGLIGLLGARRVLIAGLALAALGLAVALGLTIARWRSLHDAQSNQRAALAAAEQAFVNSLSFDYRHLGAEFATLQSESTGKFLADLKRNEPNIRRSFMSNKLTASAAVEAAAVSTVGPSRVTVIVAADETIKAAGATGSSSASPQRWQVLITMVLRHGRWLVSNLKQVA
jgi:hypothetical protein